jgi:WD40 repeat protein
VKLKKKIEGGGSARIFRFSLSGRLLFTDAAQDQELRVWNVETGDLVKEFSFRTRAVEFSADGRYWIFATDSGIRIYDVYRDTLSRIGETASAMSLAVDSKTARIAAGATGSLSIYRYTVDPLDGNVTVKLLSATTPHAPDNWIKAVAFSRDGRYVYSAARGGEIIKWDAETLAETTRFKSKVRNADTAVFDWRREKLLISDGPETQELDLASGAFRPLPELFHMPSASYLGNTDLVVVDADGRLALIKRDSLR